MQITSPSQHHPPPPPTLHGVKRYKKPTKCLKNNISFQSFIKNIQKVIKNTEASDICLKSLNWSCEFFFCCCRFLKEFWNMLWYCFKIYDPTPLSPHAICFLCHVYCFYLCIFNSLFKVPLFLLPPLYLLTPIQYSSSSNCHQYTFKPLSILYPFLYSHFYTF